MKLRVFDVIGVATVLAFAGWVGHLAMGEVVEGVERVELTDADREAGWRAGTQWQGIYLKEQKVGYLRVDHWKENDLYHVKTQMVLHLTVMKSRQRVETRMGARMDSAFVLRDFDMQISSGPADVEIRGVVREGRRVELEIESVGDVQRQTIQLAQEPRLNLSVKPMLARKNLKPGDKVSMNFFDPASLAERELVIEYKGTGTEWIMGSEVRVHHFVQNFAGVPMEFWVNDIGEVLREQLPMGLLGVRESGVEARYGVATGTTKPAADIIDAVSIVPRGARLSASARRLSLRLTGLDFQGLGLDGGRQKWTPDPAGTSGVLTLELEDSSALSGHRISDATVDGYTQPEPLIQSRSGMIRERAHSIAGDEEFVVPAAQQISSWAYGAIHKENVIGAPSAVETLQTLRGDCNEHTTLVVALLRSLGIPSRPAVGVVYLPDRQRFFYHAWVEVRAGKDWFALDPTLGQNDRADVSHIRFVSGGLAKQVEMFRVIGQLEIEVLPE